MSGPGNRTPLSDGSHDDQVVTRYVAEEDLSLQRLSEWDVSRQGLLQFLSERFVFGFHCRSVSEMFVSESPVFCNVCFFRMKDHAGINRYQFVHCAGCFACFSPSNWASEVRVNRAPGAPTVTPLAARNANLATRSRTCANQ